MLTRDWLLTACKEFIEQNKKIWIGYSGGVDSHVLLHIASQCLPNLHAVHVHHGLSRNADSWFEHCVQVCSELNVKLTSIKVDAKPKPKQSPEDAARIARRKAWADLLNSDDVLLLAQHAEDQAETILYRLFRGTGPHGLGGMQQLSIVGNAQIFRPLLNVNKQDILEYAQTNSLVWITDESNVEQRYDRNFIRAQILPVIQKRWPSATASINRCGKLTGQLNDIIKPNVLADLKSLVNVVDDSLCIDGLTQHNLIWQTEILRLWLQGFQYTATFKQLELIVRQVISCRIDANPELILDHIILRRSQNKLYCLPNADTAEVQRVEFIQSWDMADDLQLPNGNTLSKNQLGIPVALLERVANQSIVVKIGAHGRKAKKIFQQFGIPSWQRYKFPVLFANERLLGIVGLWWSDRHV